MIDAAFCESVVSWFRNNGRILPWREGRDPYRIWISEVMLQQTRIEAVIPYYKRFLEVLPDLEALADCPEETLLKLWEGLGYYSRARNLKRAAEVVKRDFSGRMPRKAAALRTLPGIGDYTAGAIASIAFGEPAPAVDGNVLRVTTRYLGDRRDILLATTKKSITEALSAVYPTGSSAADLTEGIMEIGERICIPNGAPRCELCPLRDRCVTCREVLWEEIPQKSPKKERKRVEMTVLLLTCQGKFALRKRPDEGLLAGMWEFYHVEGKQSEAWVYGHLESEGRFPLGWKALGKAKHIFTHLEWHMTGYLVPCEKETPGLVWKTPAEIEAEFALPTAFRYFQEQMKKEAD